MSIRPLLRDDASPPARRTRVLIVDNDINETDRVRSTLSPRFACEVASNGESGLAAFGAQAFDVVVASNNMLAPPAHTMSALDLLDSVRQQSADVAFILIGDDTTIATVMDAAKRGAYDYIARSLDVDMAKAVARSVDRATAAAAAAQQSDARILPPPPSTRRSESTRPLGEPVIIGGSSRLAEALDAVDRVAFSSAPVLIVGETGSGKDLIAARIHARGPRRHRPFVVVNASAIPATLLDSELFGHVAGAFTGATRARRGLVAEAEGGTLFLDEIADLPVDLQGRLLRVIESSAIRAVGADHERHVDVRFLAATQRDLRHAVEARTFREDLYFRINVLAIRVPPLRDRREDLPALISYFFDTSRTRNPRSPVQEISTAAYDSLLKWSWPGNVRELQSLIERLVVLGKSASVGLDDVDLGGGTFVGTSAPSSVDHTIAHSVAVDTNSANANGDQKMPSLRDVTTRYVETVLSSTSGDKARAAAILGIDVSTLYRWRRRQ